MMLHKSAKYFVPLICVAWLIPATAMSSDTCPGTPVQPVCEEDFVCDFETGFCGTTDGNVVSCTGTYGLGACIDGGYIDLGDADEYSPGILGFECQVIFDRLPGSGDLAAGLMTKYKNNLPADSEWGLFVEGNLYPEPRWMLTGDGTSSLISDCAVEVGVFYRVQVMICGDLAGLWVNGTLVTSGTMNMNPVNTSTPVIIGNTATHGNYFHGTIDEIRIGCVYKDCTVGTEESSWGRIKSLAR